MIAFLLDSVLEEGVSFLLERNVTDLDRVSIALKRRASYRCSFLEVRWIDIRVFTKFDTPNVHAESAEEAEEKGIKVSALPQTA